MVDLLKSFEQELPLISHFPAFTPELRSMKSIPIAVVDAYSQSAHNPVDTHVDTDSEDDEPEDNIVYAMWRSGDVGPPHINEYVQCTQPIVISQELAACGERR